MIVAFLIGLAVGFALCGALAAPLVEQAQFTAAQLRRLGDK